MITKTQIDTMTAKFDTEVEPTCDMKVVVVGGDFDSLKASMDSQDPIMQHILNEIERKLGEIL